MRFNSQQGHHVADGPGACLTTPLVHSVEMAEPAAALWEVGIVVRDRLGVASMRPRCGRGREWRAGDQPGRLLEHSQQPRVSDPHYFPGRAGLAPGSHFLLLRRAGRG